MSENKEAITLALLEAYRLTREDITGMVYGRDKYGSERVRVFVGEGDEKRLWLDVNVNCDSGCTLIHDVARAVNSAV